MKVLQLREYKVVHHDSGDSTATTAAMNELAEQGWHVVSTAGVGGRFVVTYERLRKATRSDDDDAIHSPENFLRR